MTIGIWNNLDGFQKQEDEWKKFFWKGHILYDSTYTMERNDKILSSQLFSWPPRFINASLIPCVWEWLFSLINLVTASPTSTTVTILMEIILRVDMCPQNQAMIIPSFTSFTYNVHKSHTNTQY